MAQTLDGHDVDVTTNEEWSADLTNDKKVIITERISNRIGM